MASALAGVAKFKPLDLPIGSAVLGLAGAGVGDGLTTVVAGWFPAIGTFKVGAYNVGQAALKGGMAYLLSRMDGIIGDEAATVGTLFLTASAIGTLVDVRLSLSNIISGIIGTVKVASPATATGPAGAKIAVKEQARTELPRDLTAVQTADYYSRMFGGAS